MHLHDLFGEIPVTTSEVDLWVFKVPRLAASSRRRAEYARQYRVVEKIQAAKKRGDLWQILGDCTCEFCGQALTPEPPPAPTLEKSAELARLQRRVTVLEAVISFQAGATLSQNEKTGARPVSVAARPTSGA